MFARWFLLDSAPSACIVNFVLIAVIFRYTAQASVVSLTSGNIDDVLNSNELVFVNFYADWCRFSQMLTPVFEETSQKVAEEFPESGRIVLARVDCDREGGLASRFQVSKYPTLKLFRGGQPAKKEYRGQRSTSAMLEFIRKQMESSIKLVGELEQLERIDNKKRNIIGYFDSEDSNEYRILFSKVASNLRDDCTFYAAIGPVSESQRANGNKIVFRPPGELKSDMLYPGSLTDYETMQQWTWEMCVPLVRELTFENAEELTEEGLPFMILFHHPDDTNSPERYKKQVALEYQQFQYAVNFLTADGLKFTHPLHHLGKSANDLPILAIDSFRHMYLWKHDVRADIDKPGLLRQFLEDLQSGKLHREFHHGPDPTPAPQLEEKKLHLESESGIEHIPKDSEDVDSNHTPTSGQDYDTAPPDSLFAKLAPSRNRYTLLRDEL